MTPDWITPARPGMDPTPRPMPNQESLFPQRSEGAGSASLPPMAAAAVRVLDARRTPGRPTMTGFPAAHRPASAGPGPAIPEPSRSTAGRAFPKSTSSPVSPTPLKPAPIPVQESTR
jgi:hypothetical protein